VRRLVLASGNRAKLAELRRLLAGLDVEVVPYSEVSDEPLPEETGETFEENAALKARAAAEVSGLPALADDSGLCVEALNGAPGVRSARFAGEGASYEQLVAKLLEAIAAVPPGRRGARFVCAVAAASPDGAVELVRGECAGRIAEAPRGKSGFGYDPVFVPEGDRRTFAQMSPEEKDAVSHRGRALAALRRSLEGGLLDRLVAGS